MTVSPSGSVAVTLPVTTPVAASGVPTVGDPAATGTLLAGAGEKMLVIAETTWVITWVIAVTIWLTKAPICSKNAAIGLVAVADATGAKACTAPSAAAGAGIAARSTALFETASMSGRGPVGTAAAGAV